MYATEAIIFSQIESLPIGDHLELAVQKSSQLCNVSNFTDMYFFQNLFWLIFCGLWFLDLIPAIVKTICIDKRTGNWYIDDLRIGHSS